MPILNPQGVLPWWRFAATSVQLSVVTNRRLGISSWWAIHVWFQTHRHWGTSYHWEQSKRQTDLFWQIPAAKNRVSAPQHPVLLSCVLLLLVLPLTGHLAGGSPLACHSQHEVRSFTCLINKLKESLEDSECIRGGEEQWWSDSLQQDAVGMCPPISGSRLDLGGWICCHALASPSSSLQAA